MTTKSKPPCALTLVYFLFLSLNTLVCCTTNHTHTVHEPSSENLWTEAGQMVGALLHQCLRLGTEGPPEKFPTILQRCLRRRSLMAVNRSLERDVIELADGVQLVRVRSGNESDSESRHLDARSMTTTTLDVGHRLRTFDSWKSDVLRKIAHVFDTHVLRIKLNFHGKMQPEARRRRRNMMMSLMMFGIIAVGLIMIPMGFQFLAVLGGKALLLAKMALLLSSIQGLKKIATSQLNYGLYSVGGGAPGGPGYWHYERQWPYDMEHQEANTPYKYYDASAQQADLLHPLGPRIDSFNKNEFSNQ